MIDLYQQLALVRKLYLQISVKINKPEFQFKLAVIMSSDSSRLDNLIESINCISSVVENSILCANPRRALRYCCVLKKRVDELEETVDKFYNDNVKEKLLK